METRRPPHVPNVSQPVRSAPPAMPVRELGYSTGRDYAALPGSLVAIGIISILWGLIQAAGGAAGTAMVMPAYRRSVPPPPPAPRPLPPVNLKPHRGDFVLETGLKAADRVAVVEGLRRKTKLSPDRLAIVERFLADDGAEIFPGGPLTAESVAEAVQDTGRNATGPDGSGDLATDYFTTASGRVEVDNAAVRFTPSAAGNRVPRRMSGNVYVPHNSSPGEWGARALDEWIEAEQHRQKGRLTAEQAAALISIVPGPSAVSMMAAKDGAAAAPFLPVPARSVQVEVGPQGTATAKVYTDATSNWDPGSYGTYWILPDGRHGSRRQYPQGVDPATGMINPPPPAPFTPALPGSLAAVAASLVHGVASAALSVVLVVAGVMTLARARGSAALHRFWAAGAVVLIGVGLVVSAWWAASLSDTKPPPYPYAQQPTISPATLGEWLVIGSIVGAVIQLAYPVAVLTVLRSRAAREYFAFRGEAPRVVSAGPGRVLLGTCAGVAGVVALAHLAMAATGSSILPHLTVALLAGALAAAYGAWAWRRPHAPAAS